LFSNLIHRIESSVYSTSFLLVLILGAIISTPSVALSIRLPDQIGRLNDYGNVLTMEDQGELRRKIDLLQDKQINLTVLISTRDPYMNPDIFASKLRAKWDLRGQQNENFLVFVREADGWAVRTFFATNLLNLFSAADLKNYQDRLRSKAENGEIRTGTIYAVNAIYRKAFPPERDTDEETEETDGIPLIYLLGGSIGGVLLIVLLVRWEAMRRCPECGSRLTITRSRTEFGEETIKNCPECGYRETN
jgi:predicted RNA-binding Zn-ribbon protein involved in translation (DUF1610 family)